MGNEIVHVPHIDPNIAYHIDWEFRREALRWAEDYPIGANFYPLATELHQWLLRKGQFSVFIKEPKASFLSFTNPYTYNASVIGAILARAINATHMFAAATDAIEEMEADIERIRVYNEQILYTARFCEVAIKQLLYCTQIPERHYKSASLGALLAVSCRVCKGKSSHKISLLGSLAHRYHLCLPFEQCLFEHLKIVNRRRNMEAAHSETQALCIRSAYASRMQLMQDSLEAGNELVHMLQHVSDLEALMMNELKEEMSRSN